MGRLIKPSILSRAIGEEEYTCQFEWPEDCAVQCGGSGIVFTGEKGLQEALADPVMTIVTTLAPAEVAQASPLKHYRTAFFEAFPNNPDTFIRGEGVDIAAAEASAWAQYQRYLACPGHEFEARGYENGAGFCRHCDMFQSGATAPHIPCINCGTPVWGHRDINGDMWCDACVMPEELMTEDQKWFRDFIARSRAEMDTGEAASKTAHLSLAVAG